jgi:hypothetical protein
MRNDRAFRRTHPNNINIGEREIEGLTVDGVPAADSLAAWRKKKSRRRDPFPSEERTLG